ncbi:MAG: hypothetical protein H6831_05190 [Planctomycetes bacterium]|nr:hypothetical protein [Planctomycetota bacterium]MCB9903784.1 hypothetical protein [Planctomycetota bacterium]
MKSHRYTIATTLSALLIGSTVFAAILTTRQTSQGSPTPSVPASESTPGRLTGDGSILLGDGVRARPSVSISKQLVDPETGSSVRCVSFFCAFTGQGGRLLARSTSQRVLPEASFDSIQLELGLVDPTLDEVSASNFPNASVHEYVIAISPAVDTSWGEVSRDEIVIDIVRTN